MVITMYWMTFTCMNREVKKNRWTIQCALIKCTLNIFINEFLWTGFTVQLSVDYNVKSMLWKIYEKRHFRVYGWCSRQICRHFSLASLFYLCWFFFSLSIIYYNVTKEILVVCRAYFHDVGVWILSLGLLHYCMYIFIKIEMSQSGRKSETPKSNEQMVDWLNGLTSSYYQIRLL